MRKIIFYILVLLSVALYSCDESISSMEGTKWQSSDKLILFIFTSDSTCTMQFYNNPDYQDDYQTAYYVYSYEEPNITLSIPTSSGFGSYRGTVSNNIMSLKQYGSNYIEFKKIK